jgi:hypothetical protein
MPRWTLRLCALLLALVLMPGTLEAAEDVTHWWTEGHAAHAAVEEGHDAPTSDEHGCTPTLHLCGCHASLAFVSTPTPVVVDRFGAAGPLRRTGEPCRLDGVDAAIEHPPRR